MGERAVYSTHAHVFQIDPETKRKWLPTSSSAVRVAYYHDPGRKTYRIIAIDSNKALVNSTITANMNFTKTSPKFGQWSDHRANTVYGLGFSSEKDLALFVDQFTEAKTAARDLLELRKKAQRALEHEQPQSPAASFPSPSTSVSSPSPISPPSIKSPVSPPAEVVGSPAELVGSPAHISARPPPASKQPDTLVNGASEGQTGDMTGSSESKESAALPSSSPESQVESLKYENSKLKVALASSAQNVKRWESEMQMLRNNNTRLTTALEESSQHVAEWKHQLQKYKEESETLKRKVQEMESAQHQVASQGSSELVLVRGQCASLEREGDELKEVLSAVQLDLEARTAELHEKDGENILLSERLAGLEEQVRVGKEDKEELKAQVGQLEDQLKMAAVASHRKLSDMHSCHRALGEQLAEALRLHRELAAQFDT